MRAFALLIPLAVLTACDTRKPAAPAERGMGGYGQKTAQFNYAGRWAESEPGCVDRWWDFGSDQVKTRDNMSCIFQRETPTVAGIDLEVACIGQGMSTVEQWKLAAEPGHQRMTLTRNAEMPLTLARCPDTTL